MTLTKQQKHDLVDRLTDSVHHARVLGIRVERVEGDELTLRLPYRDELVGNPDTGAVHSGVLTVLLDHTLGVAALCSDLVGPVMTPTLDLRIDHLGVAPAGRDIFAVARLYRATRRVLFAEGFAYCESRERPIARATGNFILMRELDAFRLLGIAPPGDGA